jgi:Flavin containing amine oxidoreductase
MFANARFLGPHAMILGGYGQLVNGLASTPTPLDIRYDCRVEKVAYSPVQTLNIAEKDEPAVTISCSNGEVIQADAVVLSVSLGVLKAQTITFEPELPGEKQDAISRLGFGLLNKVCPLKMTLILGCISLR